MLAGAAVIDSEICGDVTAAVLALDGSEVMTAVELGGVPWTVAVSSRLPASRSACVVTWVAVQVSLCPGASVVLGQVTVRPGRLLLTEMPFIVVSPVLVTV